MTRTRAELRRFRRTCIVMPTGAGKTRVAGEIAVRVAKQIGKKGAEALYLVHRKELLTQTGATLEEVGLEDAFGFIAPNQPLKPWCPLQIASIPTLARRLDKIDWLRPRLIFVDEAHHAAANTWAKIVQRFPRAFVIGLTATPMRHDGRGLAHIFDSLVLGPQISDLQPDFLAPVTAFSLPPAFDMEKMSLARQAGAMTGPIIADAVRNWRRLARDRKTLFFAVDIAHSRKLVERLQAQGVAAAHVDFKTPDADRARIFRDMRAGKIQCVSNSQIFTEGTDWPECEAVVLCRHTGSFTLYRQMNGRAMRRKPGGRGALVIDTAGNCHTHGDPAADVEWDLEHGTVEQAAKRKARLNRECEACGHSYPKKIPACPLCGAVPIGAIPPTEVDAAVERFEGDGKPIKPTKRRLSEEIKATGGDMEKLRALGKQYGYHPGWAHKMARVYHFAW